MDRMFVQQCRMSWTHTVALPAQHEGKLQSAGQRQARVTFENEKVAGSLLLGQTRALWYCPISLAQMSLQSQRMRVWRQGSLHIQNMLAVILQNFRHHTVTHALVASQGRQVIGFGKLKGLTSLTSPFSTWERSSESTTGKTGCLVGLNLCRYARGRVTPSLVYSDIVHFIWDHSRKPGPTQILPYGNCSETTSSRWSPSSHHRAMGMQ